MKRRDLSEPERDLWGLVTKDVKPARKRPARKSANAAPSPQAPASPSRGGQNRKAVLGGGHDLQPRGDAKIMRRAPHPKFATQISLNAGVQPPRGGGEPSKAPAHDLASRNRKRPPVFGGGDPKADKKAAKRLVPIDEVLDLHGMTERLAHARVLRFVLGAQDRGARLVLVVTGKGERKGGEGRGIIRTRFIDWVEAAPLRAAIARVAPAKPKDGGAGAFYVFLKRKSADRGPRLSKS